jgi:alkanesulfonate monooxygenase SsuD/methylene tetrahydromethanopterin reductase-like flavin-dependent oxidoreductase (luciferase family)
VPPDRSEAPVLRTPALSAGSLGLILPTFPQSDTALPSASALADTCRRAEDAGAAALWACDHLYWHSPSLEALSALTVAAVSTSRAVVGPCVLQLPLRDVATVAKQASALSHLSHGRLVLGVGVGTHRGEYVAAGVDFAHRGARLDDGIDDLRRQWALAGTGRYAQLPAPGPIPIWVGGSSEAALHRAATRGDGWIPLFVAPGEYRAAMDILDKQAGHAGRDPAQITRAMTVFVSVGGDGASDRGLGWMGSLFGIASSSFARHLVAGDARRCARTLMRYVEAGAQHLAVFMTADEPLVQFTDLAGEFAGLVACGTPDPSDELPTGRAQPALAGPPEDQLWR